MKKLLLSVLMLSVVLGAFAAGQGEDTGTSSAASGSSGPYRGELPLVEEKLTLSFATHQGTAAAMAPPSNDLPVYQKLEELTNIHIEWETLPRDAYEEVMPTRVASGMDLPDILNLSFPNNYEKLAREGIIISQSDLLEKYGYYTNQFFETDDNMIWKLLMTSPNGEFYAIENTVLSSNLSIGIMMNKKWLDRVDMDVPGTTDELYQTLKAFKQNDMNGNGKTDAIPLVAEVGRNTSNSLLYLGNAFGLELCLADGLSVDNAGRVRYDYMSPKYKELLTYLNKLYSEQLIDPNITSADYSRFAEHTTANRTGAVLWWTTYSYIFSGFSPDNEGDATGIDVHVFEPIPPVEGPDGHQYNLKRVSTAGDGMGITTECDHPVEAFKWIDFLFASPQAEMTQVWGIEGITYRMENGTPVKITEEGKEWSLKLTEIGGAQPPRAHRQTIDGWRSWMPPWLEAIDQKMQPYYRNPEVIPAQFSLEESERLKAVRTDIETYVDEMMILFIMGERSLSEFDDYVDTLESMGVDEMMQIYQQRHERVEGWMN